MELRKFIATTIREFLNEDRIFEDVNNVDKILDKISKHGRENLTSDERLYLKQYNNKNINNDFERWLFSDDESTFDLDGYKLLFAEFTDNEDIFYNDEKLKRIISKHLNKKPFRNNSDWGGGYVWNIETNNNFIGTFLYLGDNELIIINRRLDNDEYKDKVIDEITNSSELYRFFLSI